MRNCIYLICTIAIMVGCDSSSDNDALPSIEEYLARNGINAQSTNSGLQYIIQNQGSIDRPTDDDFVWAVMEGRLTNDQVFFAGDEENETVILLRTLELEGLKEGLKLIGKGGSATFFIPSDLAFGATGGINVPANSAVVFQVDLNDFATQSEIDMRDDAAIDNYVAANNLVVEKTSSGLQYTIDEAGADGFPNASSVVVVDYHGYFLDGTVFDSSIDRGTPATFSLSEVIEGWTEGIQFYGKSGKGKLLIPSRIGYGALPPNGIPPHAVLIFDVELIDFN